jgi:hypothetical protein
MFIQKIFHLRQSIDESRDRLRSLGSFSGSERGVKVRCAMDGPEGAGRLECSSATGQRIFADIEEVAGEDPNCILFRSVDGPVELAGMIELYPIRAQLTEAVLTVEYDVISPLQKAIEAMSAALDNFLNRQLEQLEGCMAPVVL